MARLAQRNSPTDGNGSAWIVPPSRHPKTLYGAIGVKETVVVLLSHFVTSPDCICGMAAPLPGCAERSSPKAACGAPEARGLTANAQPELS